MRRIRCRKYLASVILAGAYLGCVAHIALAAIEPDFLSDSDPELRIPEPIQRFNPALKELWLAALNRPEIDMQRMAAETIARAHQHGIPELNLAVPRLEEILLADSSHHAARFAAARALFVLDSRASAQKLFDASQKFEDNLRQLIEPVLARWNFAPARAVWSKRLDAPETHRRDLILAMRGLAQVHEPSVLPRLLSMSEDSANDPDLRLEAAVAVGQIAESSLAKNADRLAKDSSLKGFVNQLCAIRFLARDQSESSRKVLIELASHSEPVVIAAALHRLNEIDAALVVPLAASAMKNPDQRVRSEGSIACLKHPNADGIAQLTQLLADPHPGVRRDVCDGLARLSKQPELSDLIKAHSLQILNGDRWQGQEQAALLLGQLEYQPMADRLVELLESPRPEVMVSAAWALRKVAVPETIPAMIDKARRQTERRGEPPEPGVEDQVIHLFESLAVLKAADTVPLLIQYIPKPSLEGDRERSRRAAIWAIGKLLKGMPDPQLADAFEDRINDFAERNLERDLVKEMCAVSLARMKAVDRTPMLRGMATTKALSIRLRLAMRWAVKELTGDDLPPPEPMIAGQGNWFLQPLP